MSDEYRRIDAQNMETFRRFQRLIRGELPPEMLDELAAPDFRLMEPGLFDTPLDRDEYRALLAAREKPDATFEVVDVEPIAGALLVDVHVMPAGGDAAQRWKVIWSFWEGKVSRIHGKRIG